MTANRVVLATNGYTGDLWPHLRQTIIAVNSFQVATKPLSDNVRKSILPGSQATSDSRRIGLYSGSTIPAASCWAAADHART